MVKYLEKEEDFNEIIKGAVLVDFYADWCGPCKMLGPILESLEGVEVLKVDVDKFQALSNKYGVMSIPTLIYFKDSLEVKKEVGFKTKEDIMKMVG